MTKIFARIKRPSLRWGLFFGIILGVVEIGYNFGTSYIADAGIQSILGYILAFLFILAGFYAGLRAAQETGKWISGLIAGIWVAVFATLVFYIIPLINTFINLQAIVASQQLYLKTHPIKGVNPTDYTASDVILTQLVGMCLYMAFYALFTTVSGGLGGFVGRRRALATVTQPTEPVPEEPSLVENSEGAPEVNTEEIKDEAAK